MTTSTRSANGPGLPDRRSFLSTLSAVGALGLATTPALAAETGSIEALWPEHLRLEAIYDAAVERTWDAEEKYEEPERPKWTLNDEGGHEIIITSPGRGHCLIDHSDKNVAHLKDLIAREHEPDPEDAGCRKALSGRRARKTLAKIEEWQAEVSRRKNRAGLTKAEAAEEAARTAAYAHREAMFAIEASTFRELAHQAAILELDNFSQERAEELLKRLTDLAGVTPYGLA